MVCNAGRLNYFVSSDGFQNQSPLTPAVSGSYALGEKVAFRNTNLFHLREFPQTIRGYRSCVFLFLTSGGVLGKLSPIMISVEMLEKIKPGAMVQVQEKTGLFKGMVLARKHGTQTGATFTVRSVVGGVGVEKVYPIHSPAIVGIKVMSAPRKVKRSKLYFLRTLSKKRIRQKVGVAI